MPGPPRSPNGTVVPVGGCAVVEGVERTSVAIATPFRRAHLEVSLVLTVSSRSPPSGFAPSHVQGLAMKVRWPRRFYGLFHARGGSISGIGRPHVSHAGLSGRTANHEADSEGRHDRDNGKKAADRSPHYSGSITEMLHGESFRSCGKHHPATDQRDSETTSNRRVPREGSESDRGVGELLRPGA